MRRQRPSKKAIEATIAAGQAHGLTCTAIEHHPDGTTVVQFGGVRSNAKKQKGWFD